MKVVVLEPKTNTLLNGPNAPTEASLASWLVAHQSFHVVLPRDQPQAASPYKQKVKQPRPGPKLVPPHRETPPGPVHR